MADSSSQQSINTRVILLHIFGGICFIVLPFLFFPRPQDILAPFNNPQTVRDMIGQCLLIGFFYLTYYWLIPKFYQTKKYIVFVLIIIACFALVASLPSLFIKGNPTDAPSFSQQNFSNSYDKPPPDFSNNHKPLRDETKPPRMHGNDHHSDLAKEVNHYIFLFLVVLFFSLTLSISNQWKQERKEKTDAELSYLKAQINPHFLFNTLNSIYSLAIQKSDAAPEAVVRLAGMMRYVLHDANSEQVSLDKEIEYICDYIELQKLRFGNQVPIEFQVNGQAAGKSIAPLILIGFVENAFKHGVNAEENSHVAIDINIDKTRLLVKVRNNKVKVQHKEESGIGLQNVRDRLQHLYPATHTLSIENTDTYFLVTLTIQFA